MTTQAAATDPAGTRTQELPLTPAQLGIWLSAQQLDDPAGYAVTEVTEISGPLDPQVWCAAVRQVLAETTALRLRVVTGPEGVPMQRADAEPVEPAVVDLRREPGPLADAQAHVAAALAEPIDPAAGMVGEATLLLLDDHARAVLRVHHLALDGFGFALVGRRIAAVHAALAAGVAPPPATGDFARLVTDEVGYAASPAAEADGAHWGAQAPDVSGRTLMRGDGSRTVRVTAPVSLTPGDLVRPGRLIAAAALLAHHVTRRREVVVGIHVLARPDMTAMRTPASTQNVVPLRVEVSPWDGLDDLVSRCEAAWEESRPHHRYRHEQLRRDRRLGPEEGLADVHLNLMPFGQPLRYGPHTTATSTPAWEGPVEGLTLGARTGREGAQLVLEAPAASCDDGLATALADLAAEVLAADPGAPVGAIGATTQAQPVGAAGPWGQATLPRDLDELLASLADGGQRTAVRGATGTDVRSFAQVHADVHRWAHHLVAQGAGPRTTVGLALPRTVEALVLELAVLATGAAFVPVDPDWPAQRQRAVLAASGATLLVDADADTDAPGGTEQGGVPRPTRVRLDEATRALVAGLPTTPLAVRVAPGDPAYVLFTSGSTGAPKGVVVPRRALGDFAARFDQVVVRPTLEQARRRGRAGERLRCGHNHPFGFDSSLSPLVSLLLGHEVVLADEATSTDPARLATAYAAHGVELLDVAPVVLEQMLAAGFPLGPQDAPVGVVVGGDACSPALWQQLERADHLVALNDYGPTECTVDATTAVIAAHRTPSIGHPQPGVRALVLDDALRPAPTGVAGELYLGGRGLADGYAGSPRLTATRFVAAPGACGERLYRTGDLVRREPDGSLTFLGRADHQLSLRGQRIEPGEVETALRRLPGVGDAVAVVRDDGQGPRLVGYVVAPDLDPESARRLLRADLPAGLVPSSLVRLDALPLTARGKVDRAALPAPDVVAAPRDPARDLSAVELLVAEVFAEVLDLPVATLGPDADLFHLGGHSLTAARVAGRLTDAGSGPLTLKDIFAAPTVAQLAGRLGGLGGLPRPGSAVERPARPAGSPQPAGADVGARPGPTMTEAQRRLWFLAQTTERPDATYTIPLLLTLRGALDQESLRAALGDVVERHRTLRTTYRPDPGHDVEPVVLDPQAARERLEVVRVDDARARAATTFDLQVDLPVRAFLERVDPDHHRLLLAIHHIAADGWSLAPLVADLSAAYAARRAGASASALAPPPAEVLPAPAVTADDLDWWRAAVSGLPDETDLPADRVRPAERSPLGGEVRTTWSAATVEGLERLARQRRTTPFMVLQAALAALLTRCGAGEDVPLGTISSGRGTAADERLVTFLANTVALRCDTSGNPTWVELVDRVTAAGVEALSRSHVPFDRVVEVANPQRAGHRHPVFQVMLVLQNTAAATWAGGGLDVRIETVGTGTAKFDLTCEVGLGEAGEQAHVRFEFARDIFEPQTVERLAGWFRSLVEGLVADPGARLWDAPLAGAAECALDGEKPCVTTVSETLTDRLERVMRAHPTRVAVTDGSHELTYAALDDRSARVAAAVRRAGAGPGDLVAVAVPRGADQVAAVVGVLRAGAAYLPLDAAYPLERLVQSLAAARSAVLVVPTASDAAALLLDPEVAVTAVVALDAIDPDAVEVVDPDDPGAPAGPGARRAEPADAAYVIFTSGSTGRPKGVRVTHANVVRLLDQTQPWFSFDETDVWTLFHSYAFDFAVWEMYGALAHGGRLVVVDHDTARSPQAFLALLADERVTVLNQTPSAFAQLAAADRHDPVTGDRLALRAVVLGGEAMDPAVLPAWFERHPAGRPELVNMYGITETTVHVTYQLVDETTPGRSPVGVPIPDLGVHVLDRGLHPVPPGVVGEVYVHGGGLADGYLGQPGLTASRFVADPWGRAGERMYRSGDCAVRTADGRLDFRGRADRQVQLRGFRIELGDVEAALLRLPGVDQAHALVHRVGAGDERLVGYVVGPDPATTDPTALRHELRAFLPTQMVPSVMVVIDAFPLTVNGKLDTSALPAPVVSGSLASRPPANDLESRLVGVFAEVLGLDHVGVDDSFFDLGGHSLLAVRLLRRVREVTGREVGIGTLFASPTAAALAEVVAAAGGPASATGDEALGVLVRLRPGSTSPGVFCVHPAGGLSWCYSGLSRQLDAGTGLWGLQARGVTERDNQPVSLAAMADDYIEQLRRVQPEGPYHLLGWSLGGMVVHVMAARLQEAGHEVGVVALLDAYPSQAESGVDEPPLEDALSALLAMGGFEDSVLADRPVTLASVAEVFRAGETAMADLSILTLASLVATYRNTARILREYAHEPYAGRVDFFRAARAGVGPDHDPREWAPHVTGELVVHDLDCTHREMTQPGPLARVGEVLAARLREVQS